MNIDELIEKSKSMPNISDGGSKAYSFGDYVLVRYDGHNKYGIARDMEEQVMVAVNNKNSIGIHTPKHVAMQRVVDGEMNYCYVLQERAKGVSFTKFNVKDPTEQLVKQQELVDAPQEHFDKLASDYKELFHMGLEPKAKNIFYDKDYGFTLIDFLHYDESGANLESLSDINDLERLMEAVINPMVVNSFYTNNPEIVNKSRELHNKLQVKNYLALKKIVPAKYHRFLLRTYNRDTLDYFRASGVINEDLTLTVDEQILFNVLLNNIVNESFAKIASGDYQLWQIEMNEIRNSLRGMGLVDSFMYYPDSPIKREEFDENYDYQNAIQKYLMDMCINNFYDLILNDNSNNPNILRAKEEINNKKATR